MKTSHHLFVLLLIMAISVHAIEKVSVLLVYSAQAKAYVDAYQSSFGEKSIEEILKQGLKEMNDALKNSGVTSFEMSLAREPLQVEWTETTILTTELAKMRTDLASLRDLNSADIVFLTVLGLDYLGGGYIPGMRVFCNGTKEASLEESIGKGNHAYSIGKLAGVAGAFPGNKYVMAHEIGHNLGLLHDETSCVEEATECGISIDASLEGRATNYAHGYHDQHSPAQWNTIMSKPRDGSTRILYYSNPNLAPAVANNDAIGDWSIDKKVYAYAAKLLQDNAAIYAGWRTPCSINNCTGFCKPDAGEPFGYRCVDCLDNSNCGPNQFCNNGKCVTVNPCANANCGANKICVADANSPNGYQCVDDPCPTCPDRCITDYSTPSGSKCVECRLNSQCPTGYNCVNNVCVKQSTCTDCPPSKPHCEGTNPPTCTECAGIDSDCPSGKICRVIDGVHRCVQSFTCSQNHSISVTQTKSLMSFTVIWGDGITKDYTYTSYPAGSDHIRTWSHTYSATQAAGESNDRNITVVEKGGSITLASKTVKINCTTAPPLVTISSTPTTGLVPLTVNFTANNTGGPVDVWAWDFGDGETSNLQNSQHVYKVYGSYKALLRASGVGGTVNILQSNRTNVNVLAPNVNFSANIVSGKTPFAVQFSTTSTGGPVYTWQWNFGDGITSADQNPIHAYQNPGKYTVSLTAKGPAENCVVLKTKYITVITPKLNMVKIPNTNFLMAATEITQGEYTSVTGKSPFYFQGQDKINCPAENVSFYDAVLYCNQRSIIDGLQPIYSFDSPLTTDFTGENCTILRNLTKNEYKNGYRLPKDEEWENAFLAGTPGDANNGVYWTTGYTKDNAWYTLNSGYTTHPVGAYKNSWGLYDMAGNVGEWTWGDPANHPMLDSYGVPYARYANGGNYNSIEKWINYHVPQDRPRGVVSSSTGFRVVKKQTDITPILNLLLGD